MDKNRIKECLEYNPDTGEFFWKISKKGSSGKGSNPGTLTKKGYVDVCIDGRKYGLHRIAFVLMDKELPENVDHKNGIKSDNRWCNLRPASVRENSFNYKGTGSLSKYKNVYFDPRGKKKWFVRVTDLSGKKISCGYFFTAEEANEEAKKQRKILHGDFYFE